MCAPDLPTRTRRPNGLRRESGRAGDGWHAEIPAISTIVLQPSVHETPDYALLPNYSSRCLPVW